MNLADMHSKNATFNVSMLGRPVTLTDTEGTTYENLIGRWNAVDHVLKMDNITDSVMGSRSSIYFDMETLFNRGITPEQGWKLTGSPNKFEVAKTYFLEIPKIDSELPGKLFFLSEKKDEQTAWKGAR